MFENALVESTARVRTKARYWMIATFFFNIAVAVTVSLVPLLFPQALPKTVLMASITVPRPPTAKAAPPKQQPQQAKPSHQVSPLDANTAPSRIPTQIKEIHDDPPPSGGPVGMSQMGNSSSSGIGDVMTALGNTPSPTPTVRVEEKKGPQRVSGGVMQGQLLVKTPPVYPAIARAAHVSGTVVLHAIIAKDGTIQDLRVVSGSEMLRAAALDAVRTWRYRPYLLTGEPTEVDTTITVNFNMES